jgi:hypothetical protein
MTKRQGLLLCSLIALSAANAPEVAAVNIGVEIDVPPPAARIEVVPSPRPGQTWAPGYWSWDGGRYVWVEGRWIEARPGFYWVPERWEQRERRHHFEPGHWEREEHRERERERRG